MDIVGGCGGMLGLWGGVGCCGVFEEEWMKGMMGVGYGEGRLIMVVGFRIVEGWKIII